MRKRLRKRLRKRKCQVQMRRSLMGKGSMRARKMGMRVIRMLTFCLMKMAWQKQRQNLPMQQQM